MYHFIIVGSGWRSMFYVRIAKALPEEFTLDAMLCRSQEKADRLAAEYKIHTTTSIEECVEYKPDFVVVAVNKASIAEVSMEWMDRGFTVLCETPAGLDADTLNQLWARHQRGQKLVVAEQYTRYKSHARRIEVVNRGTIGEPSCLYLSCAHDYHGASLMRAYLNVATDEAFTIEARAFEFPSTETYNRYEHFTDGHIVNKKRTVALIEFESGKVCIYDFDSDQYRSSIRKNTVKLQGVRGEIVDNCVYYLDDDNQDAKLELTETTEKTLLEEDELAISMLMEETGRYARNEAGSPYPLKAALQDAYMALLMQEAVVSGKPVKNEKQVWNK